MKFIDLFAGLGGFHKALHELGHECVFASELNEQLRKTYFDNWEILPAGDIRKVIDMDIAQIPEHDILCAGFPCQPFSKAGKQLGRSDEGRGDLFEEIIKILKFRKPQYFILENVAFIAKHDEERTWLFIKNELESLGYEVKQQIYSPQDFGIPQHRNRIFIVGCIEGLEYFRFEDVDASKDKNIDISKFIETAPKNFKPLKEEQIRCLEIWQEFIDCIPKDDRIPGFPIWAMEFGATYPYEGLNPTKLSQKELSKYKGNFGIDLSGYSKKGQLQLLPNYAQTKAAFPDWKINYIKQSRNFYNENEKLLRKVVEKISKLPSQSWQKLEWNVGDDVRSIYNYILQFRASGIRVKKVNFFPSLVCTVTQVPIIGWQKRYITKEEGLKLQALEGLKLPEQDNAAYKALGNAVNAKIVRLIAEKLLVGQDILHDANSMATKQRKTVEDFGKIAI